MLKKLSAQKLNEIIEAAITEFAHNGREKASMKEIASASGVSVGVLYNYYENKDALYNAALEKCFENLKNVISINTHEAGSLTELFSRLVDTVYSYADEHSAYLQLYFSLTQGTEEEASFLAGKFEALSATEYTQFIERLQSEGKIRTDIGPQTLAYLFDCLLAMLQFASVVPYYKKHREAYLQEAETDRETLKQQVLSFLASAVGEEN